MIDNTVYWIGGVGDYSPHFNTNGAPLDIVIADPTIVSARSGTKEEGYGLFLTGLADGQTSLTYRDHRGTVPMDIIVQEDEPDLGDGIHVTRDAGIW